MNRLGNILKIAAALVLAIIAGCSKVDYTGSKDTPTETFVRYMLEWNGRNEVPKDMTLAMSRIYHAVHFSCTIDSLGAMTSALRDTAMVACDTLTGLTMPNGEYYVLAFNDSPDAYDLSGYQKFITDNSASMREMCISAYGYSAQEKDGLTEGMADFNPSQDYIKEMKPLWLDMQKVNIHPDIDTSVTIDPVPITQEITFRIKIESEEGVEIEQVKADISGVPQSVRLMTGQICDSLTCRVPFVMHEAGIQDSTTTYEGKVCVLGIFPSPDQTFITGPGIFHIIVKAKAKGFERTLRASINLKQAITDAGLVENVSQSERLYRIGVPEAVIDIDKKLRIEENQIVLDGDGKGVEVWIEKEDLEYEI